MLHIKDKKGQLGVIVLVVIILILVAAVVFLYKNYSSSDGKGRVVFAITDAAADMGNVQKVLITVDNIEAHRVEGDSWTTISSSARVYDLLELRNSGELVLMADSSIESGTYDNIRFEVSKVVVVDSEGEHEAKLPSNKIQIKTEMNVTENSTSTAKFDFILDESLHITGNGKYILAPVIQFESRNNAQVEIDGENRVEINGGEVKADSRVGMDINGNMGVGFKIPTNIELTIGSNGGIINVGSGLGLGLGSGNSMINTSSGVNVGL